MVDDQKVVQTDNNMKVAVTIIIVLVAMVAVLVFMLQQKKNTNTADTGTNNTTGSASNTVAPSSTSSDAGTIGKNEVKLTDANFEQEVEKSQGVFLVDFFLSTCPHCQKVAKDVTSVSDELVGKAKVGKLEASENSKSGNKYNVKGVPTFVVFKDGKEVERAEGEKTKQQLLDMVNKYLK